MNNEINNPISEMQMREMVSDTFKLYDAFVVQKPSYVVGITEQEFRTSVLPYMVGAKVLPKEHASMFINYLISKAGSESSPVPVRGNDGEVIFNIPPLINTNAISSGNLEHRTTISSISLEAKLRGDRLPIEGTKLMDFALNNPNSPIKVMDGEIVKTEMEEFFIMLEKRYGKEGTRVNKSNDKVTFIEKDDDEDLLDFD